jgi:hypothetical protein
LKDRYLQHFEDIVKNVDGFSGNIIHVSCDPTRVRMEPAGAIEISMGVLVTTSATTPKPFMHPSRN